MGITKYNNGLTVKTVEYSFPRYATSVNIDSNLTVQKAGRLYKRFVKIEWCPIDAYLGILSSHFPGGTDYCLDNGSVNVSKIEMTNLVNVTATGAKVAN